MQTATAQQIKTISVQPGETVHGDMTRDGALRFERAGCAMMGKPALQIIDGKLVLRYEDGATVILKA